MLIGKLSVFKETTWVLHLDRMNSQHSLIELKPLSFHECPRLRLWYRVAVCVLSLVQFLKKLSINESFWTSDSAFHFLLKKPVY